MEGIVVRTASELAFALQEESALGPFGTDMAMDTPIACVAYLIWRQGQSCMKTFICE
jgi:hypothetical protein